MYFRPGASGRLDEDDGFDDQYFRRRPKSFCLERARYDLDPELDLDISGIHYLEIQLPMDFLLDIQLSRADPSVRQPNMDLIPGEGPMFTIVHYGFIFKKQDQ